MIAPVLAVAAGALMPVASAAEPPMARRSSQPSPLRNGRELWATVDVCRSKPRPLIGIRGSMPTNGQSRDTMYMLFRVQYLDAATKKWADLGSGGESDFVKVGAANATRQAGRTFALAIPPDGASYRMRGVIEFQWRRRSHVVLSTTRYTSGGRHSDAGAVPRGFSASTCEMGG